MYLRNTPFDVAMDKLAFGNELLVEQTRDGFFAFESMGKENNITQIPNRIRRNNNAELNFKIIDFENQILDVSFASAPIEDVVFQLSEALNLDVFTAEPLRLAGFVNIKAKSISYDDLLIKIFEKSTAGNAGENVEQFTFKKENNIYFFGTAKQLSVRKVEVIHMLHRSVELLSDPLGGFANTRSAGRNFNSNPGTFNQVGNQFNNFSTNRNREALNTNSNQNFNVFQNKVEALVNILPDEIKKDLDIKVDYELNSFYVNGPSTNVDRFREFIKQIDKPVPVILIEVMFIEVNSGS